MITLHESVPVKNALVPLGLADHVGVARDQLLDAAHLTPDAVADPGNRLPAAAWLELWHRLVAISGDTLAGMRAGGMLEWGHFGVVDFILSTSPNLRQALGHFVRYVRILRADLSLTLRQEPGYLVLERAHPDDMNSPAHRQIAEFGTCGIARRIPRVTGVHWRPARVELRDAPLSSCADYESLAGCEVSFRAARYSVWIPDHVLDVPMAQGDDGLHR
ncbi:MAG: AraC family transcriptional regulator, partial [Myxococcota bacterium]